MPTRTQLEAWQPWLLSDSSTAIQLVIEQLDSRTTQILTEVDALDVSGRWRGDAQAAAYRGATAVRDYSAAISAAAQHLAEIARRAAETISWAREHLLALVSSAEAEGFVVADDWTVEPEPTLTGSPLLVHDLTRRRDWQDQINRAAEELDETDRDNAQRAGESSSTLPGPAETAAAGVIPGPKPPPPPDTGQAPHGSQPWYSRGDDIAVKAVVENAAAAADIAGLTHASRHLRHYLGNSGEDLTVDPDEILRDAPNVQQITNDLVYSELRSIASSVAQTGDYGRPIPFQSEWTGMYLGGVDDRDWFLAMGGIQQSVTGVATIHPPDTPGAVPTVTVDYQTHVFDRYNWDDDKSTVILGRRISDATMGGLHTAGLAQEYDISGSSSTQHFQGLLPASGRDPALPGAPDTRGGTHTDLGR